MSAARRASGSPASARPPAAPDREEVAEKEGPEQVRARAHAEVRDGETSRTDRSRAGSRTGEADSDSEPAEVAIPAPCAPCLGNAKPAPSPGGDAHTGSSTDDADDGAVSAEPQASGAGNKLGPALTQAGGETARRGAGHAEDGDAGDLRTAGMALRGRPGEARAAALIGTARSDATPRSSGAVDADATVDAEKAESAPGEAVSIEPSGVEPRIPITDAASRAAGPASPGLLVVPAANPHTSAATAISAHPTRSASVAVPIGLPAFPQAFANEVGALVLAGIGRAEIRLQPQEMGPVLIELTVDGDNTRVTFAALQPDTRAAIEQSLPVLREMLAGSGLLLADAQVSDGRGGREFQQAPSHRHPGGADPHRSPGTRHSATDDRFPAADRPHPAWRPGGLDLYA